jgi:hypothetical protein
MATRKAKPKAAPAEPALTPDEEAQVGFFAKAVDGPHKGRYGTVRSRSGDTVVFSTRDANDENLLVHIKDLRPDLAGRR